MEEIVESSEASRMDDFELKLNESAKVFLRETAKWAYFLSILGYIFIGLIVVAAVFSSTLFSTVVDSMPAKMRDLGTSFRSFMAVVYFLIAIIYFFPICYLNRFAANAKIALKANNSEALASSFRYLKSHYKYFGVIAIISICFYVLILFGALLVAISVRLNM